MKLKKQYLDGTGDPFLAHKLEAELAGICNKFLASYSKIRSTGVFTIPTGVLSDLKAYKADASTVIRFFSDSVALDDNEEMKQAELYQHYATYCEMNGERPLSSIGFFREIRRDILKDFDTRIHNKRVNGFVSKYIKGLKVSKEF